MKTTIKLPGAKSLTVEPCAKRGGILATFAFEMFGIKSSESIHLTPDQCGALIFGLESACPTLEPSPADVLWEQRKAFERACL